MSTDFSIRPVGAPAPSPVAQPPSPAAVDAVQTDLPARQSVTVADDGAAGRRPRIKSGAGSRWKTLLKLQEPVACAAYAVCCAGRSPSSAAAGKSRGDIAIDVDQRFQLRRIRIELHFDGSCQHEQADI